MSSLAPGHLLRGTRWDYLILKPIKGDGTHTSTVFKAEVVPRQNSPKTPQWALIKVAPSGDTISAKNMNRERRAYDLPGVVSADCFRKMYDVIDNGTAALEWLDTTLVALKYQPDICSYSLILTVLKSVLTSCAVLEEHRYVNTDIKTANILLSGVETGRVTAKVGDLGLVVPVGELLNAQPYAMRAPEVFLGQPCTEPSQVWAVAAMLLCWINPGVLGAWDSPRFIINEGWSMAKIKRLFPHWDLLTSDEVRSDYLKAVVDSAENFSEEVPELQAILPFDREMQKVEMPQELKCLLGSMLETDPVKRPSAFICVGFD